MAIDTGEVTGLGLSTILIVGLALIPVILFKRTGHSRIWVGLSALPFLGCVLLIGAAVIFRSKEILVVWLPFAFILWTWFLMVVSVKNWPIVAEMSTGDIS